MALDFSSHGPQGQPFSVDVKRHGTAAVILLHGDFALAHEKQFRQRVDEIPITRVEKLVLDLRDVSFVDSTGLRMILELWSWSRRDDFEFGIVPGEGQAHKVLRLAGLDQALPLVDARTLGNGHPTWA
jgi:anti-anti-sigma factor